MRGVLDPLHAAIHTAAIGTYIAAFEHWLPNVAVLVPTIYYFVVLWETKTVRHLVSRLWYKSPPRL